MSIVIRNIEQLFQQAGLLTTDLLLFRRPTAVGSQKDYSISVANLILAISSGASAPIILTISSTPYTPTHTVGDLIFLVDTTVGDITFNLLTAVGNTSMVTVKKMSADSHKVLVTPFGGQNIDGGSNAILQVKDASITMISDNTNYKII